MKKYVFLVALLLVACTGSEAENPLTNMAKALENKDPTLFLEQIDMSRYATSQINNQTNASKPLQALDAVGKMLGLGGMADLFGAVGDMKRNENERFTSGVSTGELELMCKESKKSNCPWVASSLQSAKVEEISETAAVARVTTPTNISTWVALSKIKDSWKVVGISELKDVAISYATGVEQKTKVTPTDPNAPAPPPASKDEQSETVRL